VGTACDKLRRVNVGLLHLLLCLVRAHCFASLVLTPRGYKSKQPPLRTPTSSHTNSCRLLVSFPWLKKGGREIESETGGLESVASPSLSSYGRPMLDLFRGHIGAPIEPRELGVHDGGEARNLP
jgi:hypothetical protein